MGAAARRSARRENQGCPARSGRGGQEACCNPARRCGFLTFMGYHILLSFILCAAALLPARAEPPRIPVLDAAAVPHLGPEGREDYARFLLQATPRAFALSPEGAWGWAAALPDAAATAKR